MFRDRLLRAFLLAVAVDTTLTVIAFVLSGFQSEMLNTAWALGGFLAIFTGAIYLAISGWPAPQPEPEDDQD
jgi:hypothetical protein